MSSIQEQKFLCLLKLSYDVSLKVTRAYTDINVLSKYDKRVSTFLKINKHDIFHMWKDTQCCQCISVGGANSKTKCALTLRQIERLFNFQGNGEPGHFKKDNSTNTVIQHCLCRMSERPITLKDFDINLLETLLKRFVNLESDDKMWLSTIREIRNCIAHATSTTEFDPGRLDKWWMKLEGSILGLVRKIPPEYYGEAIESQINALKNSSMEALYAKKLMENVNAENKILLKDLAERSDTRIIKCENNIKQAIIENNNEFKRHIAEVKGEFMRKLEELEAIVKGSAKQDSNTNFRIEHDSTRKIHVACQVEADDIDEYLTINNLSDPGIVETDESGDREFKIENVKQKCILLELTASPEILSSEERLLNAIDKLINRVVLAGNLDTRVPGKMTLNLTFTSPLSREEQDVFSRVFCTSDKAENIYSDVLNQFQDYSIGTVTRETQTEEQDVFSRVFCTSDKAENIYSDVLNQFQDYSIGTVTRETQTEEILVDSNNSTWNMTRQMQQEIQDLHITNELRKDNEMISAMVDPKKYANLSLKTEVQHLMTENIRKHKMQQEIEYLRRSVQHLRKENEMLVLIVDQRIHENNTLKTELQNLLEEKERLTVDKTVETLQTENDELRGKFTEKHSLSSVNQMKQIKDLRSTVVELEKEIEMLNATVDEKVKENLRLDTELQSFTKEKERITVDKTVANLQTEMDELRKKLIDKHLLIDQAHKTLSRSKSLCDLTHHSKEEIKIRSNLITRMCRESNEEEQQIFKDHTETLYESTGRSKSLQSLMQNFDNDDNLPQDETGMFGSAEDLTERGRTAQGFFRKLSMASKTTTTVQNNYNIITSNATFQKDCLVEAITATANSDRAITDS